MLDILSQAKNAIEAYNTKLRITSANIANQAVAGYKRLEVSFQSVFNRVLQQEVPATALGEEGGKNPRQTGGGVAIANVGVDFSQGEFTGGSDLDLAIAGRGLFITSPDGGTTKLYTRAGKFHVDSNNNLATETGATVYGFNISGGTTNTASLVPINLTNPATGGPYTPLGWSDDGKIGLTTTVTNPDGTTTTTVTTPLSQIALTTFNNLSGLQQVSGTAFAETLASGSPVTPTIPGGVAGTVTPKKLEQSNVFYIGETIDAMEIQRAMSGSLTVIKMINDTITQFVNRIT